MLSKQEDIEIETPILPFKPFIEIDADNNNNIKNTNVASEFSSTASEGSTPSTQRSIPPPTVQPTYIVTTTATENPSPTRRFHSIRR